MRRVLEILIATMDLEMAATARGPPARERDPRLVSRPAAAGIDGFELTRALRAGRARAYNRLITGLPRKPTGCAPRGGARLRLKTFSGGELYMR